MTFRCVEGCHACCSCPPIEAEIYERYKHLIVVVVEPVKSRDKIIPLTADKVCPFLIEGRCIIYEDRPKLCRDYGQIPAMPCPFVKLNGVPRTSREMKVVISYWNKQERKLKNDAVLKRLKE